MRSFYVPISALRSKDATNVAPGLITTSNRKLLGTEGITTNGARTLTILVDIKTCQVPLRVGETFQALGGSPDFCTTMLEENERPVSWKPGPSGSKD